MNTVRLALELSPRLDAKLTALSLGCQRSKTDVIRHALLVLEAVHQAKKDGLKVGAWVPGSDIKETFVSLLDA